MDAKTVQWLKRRQDEAYDRWMAATRKEAEENERATRKEEARKQDQHDWTMQAKGEWWEAVKVYDAAAALNKEEADEENEADAAWDNADGRPGHPGTETPAGW